jgi:hypothetical protein
MQKSPEKSFVCVEIIWNKQPAYKNVIEHDITKSFESTRAIWCV